MATAKKPKATYTVTTPVFGVCPRREPDGVILDDVIPNGKTVKIVSEADDWVETDRGWIRKRYLK